MKNKKTNKMKNISTLEFMQTYDALPVEKKIEVLTRMNTMPPHKSVTPAQLKTFKKLRAWASVNMIVGAELAPPTLEHLSTY